MTKDIKTMNYGSVNCYLIKTESGFVMIDSGFSFRRGPLEKELQRSGCQPGSLKLVVLTHGDYDHAGNAAFLQEKFGAKTAIHPGESETVERGDMTLDRRSRQGIIIRKIAPLFRFMIFTKFKPDIFIEDGDELTEYGFPAKVVHIPGHTVGSIGILTAEGDFFCGDLLTSGNKPLLNTLIDNPSEAAASIEKLKQLNVKTVYPGHGKPFPMERFLSSSDRVSRN